MKEIVFRLWYQFACDPYARARAYGSHVSLTSYWAKVSVTIYGLFFTRAA